MRHRHYYALHRRADAPVEVHRFTAVAALAAWIAEAPAEREAVNARAGVVRKALRYAAEGWAWPQKVMD